MKARHYIILGLSALALVACQQEVELSYFDTDPNAVRIHATISNIQEGPWRKPASNPTAQPATEFNDDDKIAITSEGETVIYTYDKYAPDGPVWTPDGGKYLKWKSAVQEFKAYYPANEYTGYEPVPSQQDTREAIADADFMSFRGVMEKPADGGAISLTMSRQTARVIISEIKWEEQYDPAIHKVEDIRINCIGTRDIDPYLTNGKYYALLNPGAAVDDTFITITVANTEDNTTTTETVRGIPEFEPGYSYEYSLTLGKKKAAIGAAEVTPWSDGGIIGDDENMSEEVQQYPYVDLGLPTGTLWAAYNVGATAPEETGDYFAWGETKPKSDYSWDTYKYGGYATLTKYCTNGIYGTVDDKTILDVSDDAATANWGSDWRMPTKKEMEELAVECTWTWTKNYNSTGVAGYIVSSKAAGNTNAIFLPAASFRNATDEPSSIGSYGYYWCSSLDAENNEPSRAWNFTIYSGSNNDIESNNRYYGLSIRAVYVPK